MRILNERVGADSNVGKYTYVSSIGKSVVDYVIASQSLFSRINTFSVDEPNILSDHCIAALGRPAIKITGGASTSFRPTNPRP